jgi:hypothetical protein
MLAYFVRKANIAQRRYIEIPEKYQKCSAACQNITPMKKHLISWKYPKFNSWFNLTVLSVND